MSTERPYNVRIKAEGGRAFTWTNVFADHPYRAAMAAFAEDYWPEEWEFLGADHPDRYYVTVSEALPENPVRRKAA